MNRKEQLKTWGFGNLQSTPEFKHYCDTYIYSESLLMNEEVEYILKASVEDSDAPFSYDDYDHFYYDEDELRKAILEDYKTMDTEDKKGVLDYLDFDDETAFIESLDELDTDDLKVMIEQQIDHFLNFSLDEHEHQTEVMQWFIMHDCILRELEARGEVVLNSKFWGRQSYGQAIELDGIIITIFKEWYLELYGLPFDLNAEFEEVTK
jgi:hypothetical protein